MLPQKPATVESETILCRIHVTLSLINSDGINLKAGK